MKNPKFTVFKDNRGEYRFNLFAVNGENILRSSEGYTSKQSCLKAIDSVKINSQVDSRYKRKTAVSKEYYFVLVASNGLTLGISEMYSSLYAMENGISAVKRDAPLAPVENLSLYINT